MATGKPLPGRGPSLPTPQSQRREDERRAGLVDRRLGAGGPQEPPVHVAPFPPRWAVGMLWWDTESTAENP